LLDMRVVADLQKEARQESLN